MENRYERYEKLYSLWKNKSIEDKKKEYFEMCDRLVNEFDNKINNKDSNTCDIMKAVFDVNYGLMYNEFLEQTFIIRSRWEDYLNMFKMRNINK